jgi:hypothetical protein
MRALRDTPQLLCGSAASDDDPFLTGRLSFNVQQRARSIWPLRARIQKCADSSRPVCAELRCSAAVMERTHETAKSPADSRRCVLRLAHSEVRWPSGRVLSRPLIQRHLAGFTGVVRVGFGLKVALEPASTTLLIVPAATPPSTWSSTSGSPASSSIRRPQAELVVDDERAGSSALGDERQDRDGLRSERGCRQR